MKADLPLMGGLLSAKSQNCSTSGKSVHQSCNVNSALGTDVDSFFPTKPLINKV